MYDAHFSPGQVKGDRFCRACRQEAPGTPVAYTFTYSLQNSPHTQGSLTLSLRYPYRVGGRRCGGRTPIRNLAILVLRTALLPAALLAPAVLRPGAAQRLTRLHGRLDRAGRHRRANAVQPRVLRRLTESMHNEFEHGSVRGLYLTSFY